MEEPEVDIYNRLRVDKNNTFENFKVLSGTESAVKAVKGVIGGIRPIAFIYGGYGNGKTHLLHAAAIELNQQGIFVRVLLFSDMLDTLRKSMNDDSMDYTTILNRYCLSERLIIDDIGAAGSDTEFADRILENIIVIRYGRQLMTLMTSNRDYSSLTDRVKSRLQDKVLCYLVQNKAKDYRGEK